MILSDRQKTIIEIVKESQPTKNNKISEMFIINRATIRQDLKILATTGIIEGKQMVGYFSLLHTLESLIKTIGLMDIQTKPIID